MKKTSIIVLSFLFNLFIQGQNDIMVIYQPDGVITKIPIEKIDSIIFINTDTIENQLVYDIDSNIYHIVKIGSQKWLLENLRTTRYKDGSQIPLVTDGNVWADLISDAYCWYNNDFSPYGVTYGALYNWYAVNTGNLCPSGWHVPSKDEWNILVNFLGSADVAGGKLKESGTLHWIEPNEGATNESGFTALPGGFRSSLGEFNYIGFVGTWWTASETETYAFYRGLNWDLQAVSDYYISYIQKDIGYSVRCMSY